MVRIIPPSEYARADVASPSVWSQMRATSLKSLSDSVCMSPRVSSSYFIDSLPIVAAREWSYGPRRVMQIDTMDDPQDALYTRFGEVGDIVCIRLSRNLKLVEAVQRCFGVQVQSGQNPKLRGTITHSWNVHHAKRAEEDCFKEHY